MYIGVEVAAVRPRTGPRTASGQGVVIVIQGPPTEETVTRLETKGDSSGWVHTIAQGLREFFFEVIHITLLHSLPPSSLSDFSVFLTVLTKVFHGSVWSGWWPLSWTARRS